MPVAVGLLFVYNLTARNDQVHAEIAEQASHGIEVRFDLKGMSRHLENFTCNKRPKQKFVCECFLVYSE